MVGERERIFKSEYLGAEENSFAPRADLAGKHNFSRHVFIEVDGGVSEAVRLNVLSDRHREDIIGFHFAQQYAQIHYGSQGETPQFYLVGRDNPWDIEYVMHDGTTFFLEICRVANSDLLKAMKIENDVVALISKSALAGFEIQKIEKHFPGTLPRDLVEKVKTKADRKRNFTWDNTESAPKLFLRPPINPRLNLKQELELALKKKTDKK